MEGNQLALALIAVGMLGGGAVAYTHDHQATAEPTTMASGTPLRADDVRGGAADFREIVQRYGAAVVNISTEGHMKADAAEQLDPDAPKPQLFGGRPPS